ncbi:MAG: hypothetical protein EOP80_03410 [Variovorax sp.]|nr:MAG: hypothetical protein EOP80_03410 [Variovorax sp.]
MSEIILPPWPWDGPPRDLLERRVGQLADQLRPGPVYLLVNPMLGGDPPGIEVDEEEATAEWPAGPQQAREAAWSRTVHSLHTPEFRRHKEIRFPYLVRLEGVPDPLLAASVEWAMQEHLVGCAQGGGAYRIGGWLQAHGAVDHPIALERLASNVDHDGQALARQLTRMIQWKDQLICLFDRRVLHTLRIGGTRIDWPGALQGIQRWNYLDHNFNLQTLEGPRGQPADKPLLQNATHATLIAQCLAIHRAQSILLRTVFPLPDDTLPTLAAKVEKAGHHLSYAEDQAAYAAEALLEPAFEHWPQLPQLTAAIRRTRQELADALVVLRHEWAGKPISHWSSAV